MGTARGDGVIIHRKNMSLQYKKYKSIQFGGANEEYNTILYILLYSNAYNGRYYNYLL